MVHSLYSERPDCSDRDPLMVRGCLLCPTVGNRARPSGPCGPVVLGRLAPSGESRFGPVARPDSARSDTRSREAVAGHPPGDIRIKLGDHHPDPGQPTVETASLIAGVGLLSGLIAIVARPGGLIAGVDSLGVVIAGMTPRRVVGRQLVNGAADIGKPAAVVAGARTHARTLRDRGLRRRPNFSIRRRGHYRVRRSGRYYIRRPLQPCRPSSIGDRWRGRCASAKPSGRRRSIRVGNPLGGPLRRPAASFGRGRHGLRRRCPGRHSRSSDPSGRRSRPVGNRGRGRCASVKPFSRRRSISVGTLACGRCAIPRHPLGAGWHRPTRLRRFVTASVNSRLRRPVGLPSAAPLRLPSGPARALDL
jgi:hypothetical protein